MNTPDLVVTNGRIETLEPGIGRVNALAVHRGRVVAHDQRALDAIGPTTTVVDLRGAFAMPGLIDIHNHHALAGQAELFEVVIDRGSSVEHILELIENRAMRAEQDEWIVGGSWESHLMPEIDRPETLARLDRAARGRPVMLRDDTLHNRWVNTSALTLAGIDSTTADPEGGVIRRSSRGEPTGVLLESGGLMVEKLMARSRATAATSHEQAARRAVDMLNSFGITAFQDAATSLPQMRALKSLDDAGELNAWVVSSMLCNDFIFGHDPLGEGIIEARNTTESEHHRPTFIKLFLDGVPASRTAAFLDAYVPDEEHGDCFRGHTTMNIDELQRWLSSTAERGISAKVHCTGDAAVRMFLDAVEHIRGAGHRDVIYHLAHGQLIDEDDIPRLAALGVVADASPPLWFPSPITQATDAVLPHRRAQFMSPNRSILDSGAVLAGGSDWPVCEEPNVWESIYGLVTRRDPRKRMEGTLWPEQAITLDEAVAAYTTASARAMGLTGLTGCLGINYSADFITLSHDPFAIATEDLPKVVVNQTWFAGRQVFDR